MYDLHLYWVHLFHFNDIVGDHIITGRINMINIIVNAFENVYQYTNPYKVFKVIFIIIMYLILDHL